MTKPYTPQPCPVCQHTTIYATRRKRGLYDCTCAKCGYAWPEYVQALTRVRGVKLVYPVARMNRSDFT
jgi:hypothetical protein